MATNFTQDDEIESDDIMDIFVAYLRATIPTIIYHQSNKHFPEIDNALYTEGTASVGQLNTDLDGLATEQIKASTIVDALTEQAYYYTNIQTVSVKRTITATNNYSGDNYPPYYHTGVPRFTAKESSETKSGVTHLNTTSRLTPAATGLPATLVPDKPVKGATISASKLNKYKEQLVAVLNTSINTLQITGYSVCHSSCHQSCHKSRGRR